NRTLGHHFARHALTERQLRVAERAIHAEDGIRSIVSDVGKDVGVHDRASTERRYSRIAVADVQVAPVAVLQRAKVWLHVGMERVGRFTTNRRSDLTAEQEGVIRREVVKARLRGGQHVLGNARTIRGQNAVDGVVRSTPVAIEESAVLSTREAA